MKGNLVVMVDSLENKLIRTKIKESVKTILNLSVLNVAIIVGCGCLSCGYHKKDIVLTIVKN